MHQETFNDKRRVYLDIIRIIAILMVLYNHTGAYLGVDLSADFLMLRILLAFVCKFGAALFFMVSGELLLGKTESYLVIVKKRIIRILIVMVLFSIVYALPDVSLPKIKSNLSGELNWYLFAYLGYLMMLPFLRRIAQNATETEMVFYIIIVSLMYGINAIQACTQILGGVISGCPLFYGGGTHGLWNIVYPLLGYFVYSIYNSQNRTRYGVALLFGSALSFIVHLILCINDLKINDGLSLEMIRQDLMVLPCVLFYIMIMKLPWKIHGVVLARFVYAISQCTFGVFLLETCSNLKTLWIPDVTDFCMNHGFGSYPTAIIQIIITFIIDTLVVLGLRQIPGIKRLL